MHISYPLDYPIILAIHTFWRKTMSDYFRKPQSRSRILQGDKVVLVVGDVRVYMDNGATRMGFAESVARKLKVNVG